MKLKYCTDCKHIQHSFKIEYAECSRNKDKIINLVNGMKYGGKRLFCEVERGHNIQKCCGSKGKFFEPEKPELFKKTFFEKLKDKFWWWLK